MGRKGTSRSGRDTAATTAGSADEMAAMIRQGSLLDVVSTLAEGDYSEAALVSDVLDGEGHYAGGSLAAVGFGSIYSAPTRNIARHGPRDADEKAPLNPFAACSLASDNLYHSYGRTLDHAKLVANLYRIYRSKNAKDDAWVDAQALAYIRTLRERTAEVRANLGHLESWLERLGTLAAEVEEKRRIAAEAEAAAKAQAGDAEQSPEVAASAAVVLITPIVPIVTPVALLPAPAAESAPTKKRVSRKRQPKSAVASATVVEVVEVAV